MNTMQCEPVILEIQGPAHLTEYGKGWWERQQRDWQKYLDTIIDIGKLGESELASWETTLDRLAAEGVPTNISSGVSQAMMPNLINFTTKNATPTAPAAFYTALTTVAPTSTSTGTSITEAAYTGYGRVSTASLMGAASAATPSVATNSVGAITFGACTGGTSTLAGFINVDASSVGNAIWYGTLASVTISTVNTPPTIATSTLSLSMTGT